jgi:hypothetical protein
MSSPQCSSSAERALCVQMFNVHYFQVSTLAVCFVQQTLIHRQGEQAVHTRIDRANILPNAGNRRSCMYVASAVLLSPGLAILMNFIASLNGRLLIPATSVLPSARACDSFVETMYREDSGLVGASMADGLDNPPVGCPTCKRSRILLPS